jgi:hypothetical protein
VDAGVLKVRVMRGLGPPGEELLGVRHHPVGAADAQARPGAYPDPNPMARSR